MKTCKKLTKNFQPKKNITYERYVFKQAVQLKDESSINFITRLRGLAESCNFTDPGQAVKDQFISSCSSTRLRQKLLREECITLNTHRTCKSTRNSKSSIGRDG